MNFGFFFDRLLVTPRHMIAYESGKIEWNKYQPEDTIQPAVNDRYKARAIFPLHNILKLEREKGMDLMDLRKHNVDLQDLARS